MILHSLTVTGLHAFPDPVFINLDALPPLIAVHGPNGSGKTTLFDAIAACFCGEMPYRPGALHKQFATKGMIELDWSLEGQRYRSVLRVDPGLERTEGSLFEETEGNRLLAGPLIRDYRRAIQGLVGPPDLLLAAMYSVQSGVGSFLAASRPERKALLIDLLGLKRFTLHEATCKDRMRTSETTLVGLRSRITELERRLDQKPLLQAQRAEAAERLLVAQDRLQAAEVALQDAQAMLGKVQAELARLDPIQNQVAALEAESADLAGRLKDLQGRRAAEAEILARAERIRVAVEQERAIRGQLEQLEPELTAAGQTYYQVALEAHYQAVRIREAAARELTETTREQERLARQAALLDTVPCGGKGIYASCQFLQDAAKAAGAGQGIQAARELAERTLRHLPVPARPQDPSQPLIALRARRRQDLAALAPLTGLAGRLEAAQARQEELDAQITESERAHRAKAARRDEMREQLSQLPSIRAQVHTATDAVGQATQQQRDTQRHLVALERACGQLEGQLAGILEAEAALAQAITEIGPLSEDLTDWELLRTACSPSGIPALLIDQALPELGQLATELLRECYGDEVFTIQLTTQREAAAEDKLLETLDVLIRRGGDPLEAGLLSGGERVLVSEALSLALALYAAGRSGRRIRTLLRDEVGAALDRDRSPAYVHMLRRTVQIGGFRHVLYVSHQDRAIDLADAQLAVRTGTITVS